MIHEIEKNRGILLAIVLSILFASTRAHGQDDRREVLLKALPGADREVISVLEKAGARVLVRALKTKGAVDEVTHRVHVIIDVKWTGGEKELKRLEEISTLHTVHFVGKGRISDKALAELQKSLPDVIVKRNARYMLGIVGDADPAGLRITAMQPKSPADKAGLRIDDVLQSVAGKPVKTVDELKNILIDLEPETKVDLKLKRDGEVLDVTVELTEWK